MPRWEAHGAGKKAFAASHDARAFDVSPALRRRRRILPADRHTRTHRCEIAAIAAEGYAGAALSFVNYTAELPLLCARVLPLLRQAGLREA